jgi:hypothetical protein
MSLHIFAYKEGSAGAKALANSLGIRGIKRTQSNFRASMDKVVINWGASELPAHVNGARVLNRPGIVAAMTNKLKFFQLMEDTDVRTPEFTDNMVTAAGWATDSGKTCARYKLTGHSGEGLVLFDDPNRLIRADRASLYTKYVPKKLEYRIHFACGEIIDIQRKIKDPDREVTNWQVRNHDNGFIFARNGVRDAMPHDVLDQATKTIVACGLDFGAIDIIYNGKEGQAYVLEINTAPGLVGETVNSYAEAFRQFA